MACKILILGASYGSLLSTKLLMAGHDVTLVCRTKTAELINEQGTEVRIKLRDEPEHRSFYSCEFPGTLDAKTPETVDPSKYDLVCLGMQEPQYSNHTLSSLLVRIGQAGLPCISIMNMPPLPYLRRIPGLDCSMLEPAFTNPSIWRHFQPGLMTLCSPDPQAFRPPEEPSNVLHVGLPTNFKTSKFEDEKHNRMLCALASDIDAVRVDGKDIPVKLRVHDSLFVPFAKWSMLATGNYRCVTKDHPYSICDAVQSDLSLSRNVYEFVDHLVMRLGADPADLVPFEKYARATESLLKPSSAARAIESGSELIERVDKLIMLIGRSMGLEHRAILETVAVVDERLANNGRLAA
ncbi:MAG: ketopantoate reductase family protein [Rhizobiaceae bacterium]